MYDSAPQDSAPQLKTKPNSSTVKNRLKMKTNFDISMCINGETKKKFFIYASCIRTNTQTHVYDVYVYKYICTIIYI